MNIVVNTSPLLFLSHIDRLPVLRSFGQILVPDAVLKEIKFKQDGKTQAVEHAVKEWLNVTAVQDENLLAVLTKEIGPGEAAVITIALERKADWVILDDQDARRYAHRYDLKVIGTLGVLARAKEKVSGITGKVRYDLAYKKQWNKIDRAVKRAERIINSLVPNEEHPLDKALHEIWEPVVL